MRSRCLSHTSSIIITGINKFVTSLVWEGFCCVVGFWLFFLEALIVSFVVNWSDGL